MITCGSYCTLCFQVYPCIIGISVSHGSLVFILKLSDSYCLLSGRRTTHNPFSSRDKPWDPYGVAKFDLSGLLLGQKYLHLRSPIHCCPLPDTHSGLQKPDGPVVGHPGNVDGPGTFLHEVP